MYYLISYYLIQLGFVMSKHKEPHLPVNPLLLQLPPPLLAPERLAEAETLQSQHEIHLTNQSDDESIFEESAVRMRGKKNKSLLSLEIQNLRKENSGLVGKNQGLEGRLEEVGLELKQKEIEYKHSLASINDLKQSLRASQSRKSALEMDLSKALHQLQTHRQEVQNYEKQVSRLLNLHCSKDSQIIDLMHRHSQQIKQEKLNHKSVIKEYETKQEETKKLLKKLNEINQQKEEKLKEEIESLQLHNSRLTAQVKQREEEAGKYEEENQILQEYLRSNTGKYESDLITIKMESDKVIRELKLSKQAEVEEMGERLRRESGELKEEIGMWRGRVESEEVGWRERLEEKERVMGEINSRYEEREGEFERVIREKSEEIEKLVGEIERMRGLIERQQGDWTQLSVKNESLQNSLKEIYHSSSQLQSQLLEANRQRASLTSQNTSIKHQVQQLKEAKIQLEHRLQEVESTLISVEESLKEQREVSEKLKGEMNYYKNSLQIVQTQYNQLIDVHSSQKKNHSHLRDSLLESETSNQNLKDKCIKLQIFIDNFKVSSEKNRQKTESKWAELREVYERQLDELEGKVIESEKRYNSLKLKLEKSERDNKIYQFENTSSPSSEPPPGVYYQK